MADWTTIPSLAAAGQTRCSGAPATTPCSATSRHRRRSLKRSILYGGDGDDRFALQDIDADLFFGDAGYDRIFVYRNTDLAPMDGIEEIVIARNPVFLTVTS